MGRVSLLALSCCCLAIASCGAPPPPPTPAERAEQAARDAGEAARQAVEKAGEAIRKLGEAAGAAGEAASEAVSPADADEAAPVEEAPVEPLEDPSVQRDAGAATSEAAERLLEATLEAAHRVQAAGQGVVDAIREDREAREQSE